MCWALLLEFNVNYSKYFVMYAFYLKNKRLIVEGVHVNEQWVAHESFSSSLGQRVKLYVLW